MVRFAADVAGGSAALADAIRIAEELPTAEPAYSDAKNEFHAVARSNRFQCPACGQPMNINLPAEPLGRRRRPHFSHRAKNNQIAECPETYAGAEQTQLHLKMIAVMLDRLKSLDPEAHPQIDMKLGEGKRRPDIAAWKHDRPVIVELQHSRLTAAEAERRDKDHRRSLPSPNTLRLWIFDCHGDSSIRFRYNAGQQRRPKNDDPQVDLSTTHMALLHSGCSIAWMVFDDEENPSHLRLPYYSWSRQEEIRANESWGTDHPYSVQFALHPPLHRKTFRTRVVDVPIDECSVSQDHERWTAKQVEQRIYQRNAQQQRRLTESRKSAVVRKSRESAQRDEVGTTGPPDHRDSSTPKYSQLFALVPNPVTLDPSHRKPVLTQEPTTTVPPRPAAPIPDSAHKPLQHAVRGRSRWDSFIRWAKALWRDS